MASAPGRWLVPVLVLLLAAPACRQAHHSNDLAATPEAAIRQMLRAMATGDCPSLHAVLPPEHVPPWPTFRPECEHMFSIEHRSTMKKLALAEITWDVETIDETSSRATVQVRPVGLPDPWGCRFQVIMDDGGWRVLGLFDSTRKNLALVQPRPAPPRHPSTVNITEDMVGFPAMRLEIGAARDRLRNPYLPRQTVEVAAFALDRREVTVGEFAACVTAGECSKAAFSTAVAQAGCQFGSDENAKMPMNCVSWWGAAQYCRWRGARLPTEVEFEAASAGKSRRLHPWGNTAPNCNRAVMAGCDGNGPRPPCSRPSGNTPEGICDLAGNVSEWTAMADDYDIEATLRGGAYDSLANAIRSTSRRPIGVAFMVPFAGFRCARKQRSGGPDGD